MIIGRMDEAQEQSRLAMELDPLNPIVQSFHGQVLIVAGHLDEAIAVCQNTLRTALDNPVAILGLLAAYHLKGMHREALDAERAASWAQRAVDLHDANAPYLASEPLSDELRNDPRFEEVLRRMGLPST